VTGYRIHPNILMGITVGVCRSDITGESFQGIGVQPDLPCKADAALNVAHVRAPTDPEREELQQTLDALRAAK